MKHKKSDDDLVSMYNVLQEMETEDPPVFATMNLNITPYVDLKNVDGVSLMYKQSKLEICQQELLQQQSIMRDQLVEITGFLQKIDTRTLEREQLSVPLYSDVTNQRKSIEQTIRFPNSEPSLPNPSFSVVPMSI